MVQIFYTFHSTYCWRRYEGGPKIANIVSNTVLHICYLWIISYLSYRQLKLCRTYIALVRETYNTHESRQYNKKPCTHDIYEERYTLPTNLATLRHFIDKWVCYIPALLALLLIFVQVVVVKGGGEVEGEVDYRHRGESEIYSGDRRTLHWSRLMNQFIAVDFY